MKNLKAKQKPLDDETDDEKTEESPWLAEIRSALSPYWSARTAYHDRKTDKAA